MTRTALPFMMAMAAATLLAVPTAQAQSRGEVEDACRAKLASRGYRSVRLEDKDFDRKSNRTVLTARFRARGDRYQIECKVDRDGKVRDLDVDRKGDDHGRPGTNDRPRQYQQLVGADAATLDQQMRAMGFEPKRPGYWFLGSTGECVAVRMAGNRVADLRKAEVRDCR